MSKNSKFISKSFNREGLFNYFLIPYFAVLIYFVYKTSNTLPPFRDEAVSLSANISFYLEGLSFKGPAGTKFEGSYSPYLTSPPLSAVGSSIAWIFSDNFNTIRISNFIWVFIEIFNLNKPFIFKSFKTIIQFTKTKSQLFCQFSLRRIRILFNFS